MVKGTITYNGYVYKNGLEGLEIWVDKKEGKGLPNEYGKRVPIDLSIRREKYTAGLRSTVNCPYIWICPDLRDKNGKKISLAEVLKENNLGRNERVALLVNRKHIFLRPLR